MVLSYGTGTWQLILLVDHSTTFKVSGRTSRLIRFSIAECGYALLVSIAVFVRVFEDSSRLEGRCWPLIEEVLADD